MLTFRKYVCPCSFSFKTCLSQQDLREVWVSDGNFSHEEMDTKIVFPNAKCQMEESSLTPTTSQGEGDRIFMHEWWGFYLCVLFIFSVITEIKTRLSGKMSFWHQRNGQRQIWQGGWNCVVGEGEPAAPLQYDQCWLLLLCPASQVSYSAQEGGCNQVTRPEF